MSSHTKRDRLAALGLQRMEYARRLLLLDRDPSGWFEAASTAGEAGLYMARNWYARGRVAMHNNGAILANDTNWAIYKAELERWPSLLWCGLLTAEKLLEGARKCYQSGRGKLAMTTRTSETVTITPATWIPRNLRRVNEAEILHWCGVIGGKLPPVQTGPAQTPLQQRQEEG